MSSEHNPIFFDVGAHQGWTTQFWKSKYPNAIVHAFKPERDNFAIAKRTLGNFKDVHLYETAIGETDGSTTFYVSNYNACSSLLPFDEDGTKKWNNGGSHMPILTTKDTYDVKTMRIDTFMNENGITHVDFLKIDTQGYDFYVVETGCGPIIS